MKTKIPESLKMQGKTPGYFILALVALCFLLYANSLNNAFISDDIPAILNNPSISHPLRFWLDPASFLNSLNYLACGYNPFTYHLTNIILHSLNTILVLFFLSLFFKREASFLGACLFAAHPIHAEAVTWVSGKPYIITSIFILAGYFLYYHFTTVKADKRIKPWRYILCLLLFSYYVIANVSFYFIFPVFIILSDITFGRVRKNYKYWLLFLGIVILRLVLARSEIMQRISFVAHEAGREVTGTIPSLNLDFSRNLIFNLSYSFFSHMRLLLWPAKLTLYHEPAVISASALYVELLFLVPLMIISMLAIFNVIFKRAKELFFGLGIFVLFLAPTYSPVMVSWLVAERYLYFPSIILSIFLAFFYEKITVESKRFARPALAVFIFIIAILGVRTVIRNEDWKTQERFWRQTVLVSYNSPRSHNNMGDVYGQEGNTDGAIREFKKAIELRPGYADAYHNLANVYHHKGDLKAAVNFYQQAVSFNPKLFESYYNLGLIYLNSGEFDLAKLELEKALEIRPEDESARQALELANEKAKS